MARANHRGMKRERWERLVRWEDAGLVKCRVCQSPCESRLLEKPGVDSGIPPRDAVKAPGWKFQFRCRHCGHTWLAEE